MNSNIQIEINATHLRHLRNATSIRSKKQSRASRGLETEELHDGMVADCMQLT